MPAVQKNISWFKGEDVAFPDTITQADGVTAQNITGWSVQFVLHKYLDDGTPLITKTVGAGIVLTTPTSGLLTVTVLSADTATMAYGLYWWRIERTDAGADAVVSYGTVELRAK